MGIAKTTLEYISLTTGNWVTATTPDGGDAVLMLTVDQSLNSAAKAELIISNRSPNPEATSIAAAKGYLADTFAEFQRIRLVHQDKGIPIFSGRIYMLADRYDMQYGQVIKMVAFDSFKELLQFPIQNAASSLKKVNTTVTSSSPGGYDLRKRSQLIKYMLAETGVKDTNLLTTDVDQFEDSWSITSLGDKKLNLVKISRHAGDIMRELAIVDPVKTQGGTAIGESGYDFRVEPRLVSCAASSAPIESLHYFMRGTRPGKGGAYGNAAAPVLTSTATDSLSIIYGGDAPDSGLKQSMLPSFEFDKPKQELYTAVICHYTDEGREDESNEGESGGKKEGIVTFELLKGTAISGTFTWANKALDATKNTGNRPELLNVSGGASGVARVQWQTDDGNLLLISNIDEAAFPSTDATFVLTGATSGATFTFNPTEGRMKTKYGLRRPLRLQRTLSNDLGIIRDEIVSRLVGRLDLVIIRGTFQTTEYPIVYHDLVNTATPPASTASRSGNVITWTGAIAAKDRGIRIGHTIAEISSAGEYLRYAYISAVTNDRSITYGTGATDTSDGTALNISNTIRVLIPIRPGDIVKVTNFPSGIDTDQVVLALGYDEQPGAYASRWSTTGSNNKFNNIYAAANAIRSVVAENAPHGFPVEQSLGDTAFFFNGFVNRGTNPSGANDYRQIHWTNAASNTSGTSGTLTAGDGTKYTIACALSPILTTAEHTIFFRPTTAASTVNTSDTAFQVVLTTSYNKDADDIQVGWCKASDNKAGAKAVLVLAPQFSSKDLFASGQNGSLTEALLSKSAQEYSSGLEITPLTSGDDRHLQITWAACTATSGSTESPDDRLTFGDGDVWIIAAKDGSNYSVTSNGTSYSNITALTHSSTYYAFIDTADTAAGGSLTLRFTTKYGHISTADDGTFSSSRVIMAQIAVPTNGDDGSAPRVFPFNNRSLTINAASIAADSITTTHLTATSIQAEHLDIGTGSGQIGGLTTAGLVDLSNTNNANAVTGGTRGFNGLNANNRVQLPIGSQEGSAKFVSFTNGEGTAVILDNLGLVGYSQASSLGTFPSLDLSSATKEFEIRADTGKAQFADGKVVADCGGLTLTSTGSVAQIKFFNEASPSVRLGGFYSLGDTTYWIAEEGKSLFLGDAETGADHDTETITLVSNYIKFVNVSATNGTTFGTDAPQWRFPALGPSSSNQVLIGTLVNPGSGAGHVNLTWSDTIKAGDGASDAPSYSFNSDTESGMRYFSSGGYVGITLTANSRFVCAAKSNGSTDVLDMDAHIDMNGFDIEDCDDIDCDKLISSGTIEANVIARIDGVSHIRVSSTLLPMIDNFYNLGAATPEWATIFCNTLTESSDSRIKTDIQDLTNSDSLVFIDSLRPRSYKRLDNQGETIDNVRYGLVAQEVEEALTGLNIDKTKLNLIHLPDTETITQVIDPDGTEAEVPNPRGLSYTQLIAPLIGAVKELKARIEVLEGN